MRNDRIKSLSFMTYDSVCQSYLHSSSGYIDFICMFLFGYSIYQLGLLTSSLNDYLLSAAKCDLPLFCLSPGSWSSRDFHICVSYFS